MHAVTDLDFENVDAIKGHEEATSRSLLRNPVTRRFLQEVFVEHSALKAKHVLSTVAREENVPEGLLMLCRLDGSAPPSPDGETGCAELAPHESLKS